MELISTYLYNRVPVDTNDILNLTFHSLKRDGWYSDRRSNKKFMILNKRFEINGQWYRVLIRFEYKGLKEGREIFQLSLPCPFIITECEEVYNDAGVGSWKDTKTYHGRKLKNVTGFFEHGVPLELIDYVYGDIREHIKYFA